MWFFSHFTRKLRSLTWRNKMKFHLCTIIVPWLYLKKSIDTAVLQPGFIVKYIDATKTNFPRSLLPQSGIWNIGDSSLQVADQFLAFCSIMTLFPSRWFSKDHFNSTHSLKIKHSVQGLHFKRQKSAAPYVWGIMLVLKLRWNSEDKSSI